jgi:hypothetical protein
MYLFDQTAQKKKETLAKAVATVNNRPEGRSRGYFSGVAPNRGKKKQRVNSRGYPNT